MDGRDVSVDGTKLDTVETNADVTDTTNVTAAGALMDSELVDSASVKALNQSVISGASPTFGTANFTDATNKRFMTDAQETKLDTVETNADVTDTANVTLAGALMDSELADSAAVKALDQSVISGASPTFSTANMTDASNKRFMTNAQETKLDGVAAGAEVNRTASATLTLIKTVDGTTSGLDADLLDGQHGSYYGTVTAVSANSTAIGTLGSLSSDITVDRTNLVAAINELQGDINQINSSGASANNTIIGTLTQMLTSEDSDVVGAINELHTETLANTTKLSGIDSGADVTLSQISAGTNISISGSGVISSTDTNTTYSTATSSALGLVKIGYTLDGANRNYPVELSSGKMYVNVPWVADTDTNTQNQYSTSVVSSSGIKLRLSGTGHSGSTTDDVKFVGAGGTAVSRTDASTITITSTDTNTQLSNEQVQDIVGGMLGGTETGITVTYQDTTGDINFVLDTPTDNNFTTTLKNKLDAIDAGAQVNRTAAATLTLIKTVDGAGSGLDADLLDGQSSAYYATAASVPLVFNAAGSQLN